MNQPKNRRATMPWVASVIDATREAFGADQVNPAMRAGMEGQPTFYARENGQEVGTPIPYDPEKVVRVEDLALPNTCHTCAYAKLKIASPTGERRERRCTRYNRPALAVCADWREA